MNERRKAYPNELFHTSVAKSGEGIVNILLQYVPGMAWEFEKIIESNSSGDNRGSAARLAEFLNSKMSYIPIEYRFQGNAKWTPARAATVFEQYIRMTGKPRRYSTDNARQAARSGVPSKKRR